MSRPVRFDASRITRIRRTLNARCPRFSVSNSFLVEANSTQRVEFLMRG